MTRFWVTWSEVRVRGAEIVAENAEDAIRRAKDGDYMFAEDYGAELDLDTFDVEEM